MRRRAWRRLIGAAVVGVGAAAVLWTLRQRRLPAQSGKDTWAPNATPPLAPKSVADEEAADSGQRTLPYLPARHQQRSRNCVAYALVAAMESWILSHKPGLARRLPLSESDLLSFENGQALLPAVRFLTDYGIVETGATSERRQTNAAQRRNAPHRFWRIAYTELPPVGLLEKQRLIRQAVDQGHPLVTSMFVDRAFASHDSQDPYVCGEALPEAHAICIVGYDMTRATWIAKNSMGSTWGFDGGCFHFPLATRRTDHGLKAEETVRRIDRVIPPVEFE